MKPLNKKLFIAACILLVTVIAVLGINVYRMDVKTEAELAAISSQSQTGTEHKWTLEYNGAEHRIGRYVATYLLVGTDNADTAPSNVHVKKFYNHSQADFIMLLAVDEDDRKITAIQINRDTMTDVPWLDVLGKYGGTVYRQIALAYNSGSGGTDSLDNTADAVSRLLFGVSIDHSIALSMKGISALNDAVGGVTVRIQDDLTPVDGSLKKGSTVTLHGEQAEHFLRARMDLEDDTNTARMSRHREYIDGFIFSAKEALDSDPQLLAKAADELSPYLVTEMTSDELLHLADCVQKYGIDSIRYAEGELRTGEYYEFYPDMEDLWRIVKEIFDITDRA